MGAWSCWFDRAVRAPTCQVWVYRSQDAFVGGGLVTSEAMLTSEGIITSDNV